MSLLDLFGKKKEGMKDPQSFEMMHLQDFFISGKKTDEDRFACLKQLNAKQDGLLLVKVLKRRIRIDFNVVSFEKLFSVKGCDRFSKLLIETDEEVSRIRREHSHVEAQVQYLCADEEEGEIVYLIGIYADVDLSSLDPLKERVCRLHDFSEEDLKDCIDHSQIGDMAILSKIGSRIRCDIDKIHGIGYLCQNASNELNRYFSDPYLVVAEIAKKREEPPYVIYVKVSVYDHPFIGKEEKGS